jgi:membrane protein DedA with SNARE-associated domain
MTIKHLIETYGVLAVFVGTIFEGETIVILAALAANQGYLPLWQVVLAAFAGACSADQFYFFLGRWQGRSLISKRPAWQKRSEKATRLIERFHVWIIPAIRYLYGMRSVLCILIGMSRVSGWTFAILNTAGVAVWTILTCFGGYYMGRAMKVIRKYEMAVVVLLAVVGLATLIFKHYRRRRNYT